jgi:hypothetical protein
MVSMALFLLARQASLFPDRGARVALLLEVLSVPFALVVGLSLTDAFAPALADGLAAPLFASLYTVLALDILRRTGSRRLGVLIGVSIGLFVALSFTLNVAMNSSALTALLSIVAGVILLLWGLAGRKPFASFAGAITLIAGAWFGFDEIARLIMTSSWIDLAIFGASAIALGSIVDRHGVAIKLRLVKWFDTVGEKNGQVSLQN